MYSKSHLVFFFLIVWTPKIGKNFDSPPYSRACLRRSEIYLPERVLVEKVQTLQFSSVNSTKKIFSMVEAGYKKQ